MSSTPFWKKIYQTVSGHSQNITQEIIQEILELSRNELMEGFITYKPYSKQRKEAWNSNTNGGHYMKEFVNDLSKDLNLDPMIADSIMRNYLMFEYYGKIKEFWQITRIGTTVHLKECIWNFYTAERMFLLKIWRHIFEHVDNVDYEFSQQYREFLNSIPVNDLQSNIMKQFEELMNEITTRNFKGENPYLEKWLCRNSREQTELMLILTLTFNHQTLSVPQLTQLIKLFIQNNFGTQPLIFEIRKYSKKQDLEDLKNTEMGCYFVALQSYWDEDLIDFWRQEISKDLEKTLLSLQLNPLHPIIMLAWLVLKFKVLHNGEDGEVVFDFISREPFVVLHGIISKDIFKNCVVGEMVIQAAHKLVDQLCLMYDDRKVLYEQNGIISVLAIFLRDTELAKTCLQTRNGLDAIMEIAIETFPYDFFAFTGIAEALLAQPSQYKSTIYLLNNVPNFLSDMTWTIPKEEISVLRKHQLAFPDSDLIVFPPKTVVRSYGIFGKNLVQYRGTYSYFHFLEYLVNLLINMGLSARKFEEGLIQKILAGYGVVIQGIKSCVDMDLEKVGLKRIVEKVNKLLIHLDGPLLHFDLIKLYFDVQNAMMEYRHGNFFEVCPEIVWKIFFPKLKLEFVREEGKNILLNQYIFEQTIFMKLFKEEEYKEDHALLLTYINILYNVIKMKFHYGNFQLSGLAYLLNCVFIQHQSWIYKDENQKTRITLGCLKIFHHILQKEVNDLTEAEQRIFYFCQYAFLYDVYIIESFLNLFIKEKYHLIFLMEEESNWTKGPSLDRLKCIQMQLALLLLIMNQKKSFEKCTFSDRLWFIVKPVASYFTNSYSPVIAELSCRFLEKLAQDPSVPLLGLLELDHYQVQSLFLERLRDPLEEEKVKLAIIDLINTCISNQNGMTAAFFNLKCFMYWDGTENNVFSGDSVSDFMVDYLQNIKKSHEYFKNPLQLGILRLLYNLWVNHRENLIENIANLKDFWPVMVDPFFCDFVQEIEIYSVILKIINLEIGANLDNVEAKLITTVDRFLKDKEIMKEWIKFVLASTKSPSKNNLDLLSAWVEFVVLTKIVTPKSFDDDIKIAFINSCLDGLNTPEGGSNNVEIVYSWSQLYLMLISAWAVPPNQQNAVVKKLLKFIHSLHAYYKYLTPKIKEIILSGINKTIIYLQTYFNNDTTSLTTFLHSVGTIIDMEYEYFLADVWSPEDDSEKIGRLKPWLIIIFIGNSILDLENLDEIAVWFSYRKFLQRVMDSVDPMLQHRSTLPFVKLAINFLIRYAGSSLVNDFLSIDMFGFYYTVRPPSLTITIGEAVLHGVPANLKEWWLIFITLIKLNRTLINKVGSTMLSACFTFISQHDVLLRDIISLTKSTVDMTALALVCETLKLIHMIIRSMPHWSVQYPHSYELIMDGVKTTLNACVLSILGYKKINFYNISGGKNLVVMSCPPTDLLVSLLNKLTEIIYWSSLCLIRTKPDIISQLESQYEPENIVLLVKNDFSVPRFELPISSKLAYGSLLCLADYLCKILNQLSPTTPSATPRRRQVSLTDLHNEIKVKSLGTIFEHCISTYEKCIGFMVYIQRSDDLPNEKLSSFLHYDMSEFSGSNSAVSQLDYHVVKNSLEALMSFLAGEIFYTMRLLDEETLFSYKRELSSEIQFFYEFVRKRTSEQYNAMAITPRTSSLLQSETDIIKRYMVTKMNAGDIKSVADKNFFLVISQWLIKFCNLSN